MSVSQLKAARRSKKDLRSAYVSRKNAVARIVNKIDSQDDFVTRTINESIGSCHSIFSMALKGAGKESKIPSAMADELESPFSVDSKISSCRDNLHREVVRCENAIDSLDGEIGSLEYQIYAQGGTIHFWE